MYILKIINCFRSFYGYHSKNAKFFKIFFYNPYSVKVAVDLLQVNRILITFFKYLFLYLKN